MTRLTIQDLEDDLTILLQQRADEHGRSLEEEATEILRTVLIEKNEKPLNLTWAIEQRFARFWDFEIPTISPEPLREAPDFEDFFEEEEDWQD